MTCALCRYEFCWVCGASASRAENHFEPNRGCGARMMDESAKPGDHLSRVAEWNDQEKARKRREAAKIALYVILFIIFLPLIAVCWVPVLLIHKELTEPEIRKTWCHTL